MPYLCFLTRTVKRIKRRYCLIDLTFDDKARVIDQIGIAHFAQVRRLKTTDIIEHSGHGLAELGRGAISQAFTQGRSGNGQGTRKRGQRHAARSNRQGRYILGRWPHTLNVFDVDVQFFSHDLRQTGVRVLPHIHSREKHMADTAGTDLHPSCARGFVGKNDRWRNGDGVFTQCVHSGHASRHPTRRDQEFTARDGSHYEVLRMTRAAFLMDLRIRS